MQLDTGVDVTNPPCPATPTAVDYAMLYKPTRGRHVGACSAADMAAINAAAAKDYPDVIAAVKASQACAACALSNPNDATWGPLVLDAKGQYSFTNWGACYEVVSDAQCAKQQQEFFNCDVVACAKCSANERQKCSDDVNASGGLCQQAFNNSIFGTCTDSNIVAVDATCGIKLVENIDYLCGSGKSPATVR